MESLESARQLIGHTLVYHILIVSVSIGLPVLMSIFEFIAWRQNDERLKAFVRLLARWAAVFVIGGIFTGTMVALQLSTLWAPFLDEARPHVGKFFQLEGYMFLIEAAFLSWYLMTLKQVGTLKHVLIGIPISIGTIGSAFFITTVNAWMNNPNNVFTSTTVNEISHSVMSYLFSTALVVMGYIAYRSVRTANAPKPTREFLRRLLGRVAVVTGVFLAILAFLGHQSAVDIAHTQPHKLAAMELLDKTQDTAPLRLGGEVNDQGEAEGGIVIPGALSLLAGFSLNYEVKGLEEIPRDKWPPLIIHALFDIKMGLVMLASSIVALALFFYIRRRPFPRWFLLGLVPLSLVGFVMVELGWLITEFGRQPYTIVGIQTTAAGHTPGAELFSSVPIFLSLFTLMTIAIVLALRHTTLRWRNAEKYSW